MGARKEPGAGGRRRRRLDLKDSWTQRAVSSPFGARKVSAAPTGGAKRPPPRKPGGGEWRVGEGHAPRPLSQPPALSPRPAAGDASPESGRGTRGAAGRGGPRGSSGQGADARQLCGLLAGSFHAAERSRQLLGASRRWRRGRDSEPKATGSLSERRADQGGGSGAWELVVGEGSPRGRGRLVERGVWGTDSPRLDRERGPLPLIC